MASHSRVGYGLVGMRVNAGIRTTIQARDHKTQDRNGLNRGNSEEKHRKLT